MSYEDIVEAQAKRVAKEAAVVKGKSCSEAQKLCTSGSAGQRARKNEAEVAEDEIEAQGLGNYCSGSVDEAGKLRTLSRAITVQ
jgi:hypothetical protein